MFNTKAAKTEIIDRIYKELHEESKQLTLDLTTIDKLATILVKLTESAKNDK